MKTPLNISKELYTSIHKCIRCGQCTYGKDEAEYTQLCPINSVGNFFAYSAGGLMQIARLIYEGKLEVEESLKDIIFKCTTCGICESNCGVIYDHQAVIVKMKELYLQKYADTLSALVAVNDAILEHKNPYGRDNTTRNDWVKERKSAGGKTEILYFTGCVSAFDQKEIPRAFVGILDSLGIAYEISDDEWCCGLPAYYNGKETGAANLARHNLEMVKRSGVGTVVFSCPTCMLAFKKFYPQWLGRELPFSIMHSTEYLDQLMRNGILMPGRDIVPQKVVYHDSCHLGRELGVFDEPRNLLSAFAGIPVEEYALSRENSSCCGGGGMVPVSDPRFSYEIASQRIDQIPENQNQLLVMACPNCRKTLRLAMKKMKKKTRVMDVLEVIYQAL